MPPSVAGYRYITEPEGGGNHQMYYREIQNPAYAAAVALKYVSGHTEKFFVELQLITGALALTADVTQPHPMDEMTLVLPADATGRTVTFGAGFTVQSATLVLASNAVGTMRFVFSTQSNTWVEVGRNIQTVSTVGGNNTFTGNNTFSGTMAINGQATFGVPYIVKIAAPAAINSTATATAAQMAAGVITSTSGAATGITTPTATALATQLGAGAGSTYDFAIDNSSGANTVTLILDPSIVALAVVTGGNTLTVASGKAGLFRIYFTSPTAAFIARLG